MRIILKIILVTFLILIFILSYLSLIGLETKSFNKQITNKIQNLNENLKIELKEVKLILDPFRLKINAKTIGSKLIIRDKIIEIESIKTQISLRSLIENKFLVKNLDISSKSIEIKNLLSFIRSFHQSPELYVLEKIIRKGYLVADIKLEFDKSGTIKNNYIINGFVKNTKLSLLEKYNIEKLDLIFNYTKDNLILEDIKLLMNDINLLSKKISLQNIQNNFLIKGYINHKKFDFNKKDIELFINPLLPYLNIDKINFSSKNNFSLKIDKNFRLKDYEINSDILLNEFTVKNNQNLKKIFQQNKGIIRVLNNELKLIYNKNSFSINGSGNIFFQENNDFIKYQLKKNNKTFEFKTSLTINDNPFEIDLLNYQKDPNAEMSINLEGINIKNDKTIINQFYLNENKNKIEIKDLILNKNFKVTDLSNINLNYHDKKKEYNSIQLYKKGAEFFLKGLFFNANNLIDNLLDDNESNSNFLEIDKKINIDLNKIRLDENYILEKFSGYLSFKDKKIENANLNGNFLNNKKLKFTVNNNSNDKITTLYLGEAGPIVNRYKFVKGFSSGELDFYSSEKLGQSFSTLKIYNFKLKELPLLTKILTLASLQGIADILTGEGIRFNEFEMNFRNNGNLMTIDEIYAIGPSISILMDGYIEKNKLISLRGTLVPASTLNKVIGSIPLIGKILVGSKTGEGIFGVSFKIKGPPKNLETTVNPIKTLTPRFITRTMEKIKKN
tara:strand:- start:6 stop:2192 length:2187 start_codon:yes stop_codon:yes gene_type:complete